MRKKPDHTQPLPNPRHEAFVQCLLRGESQDAAYASAGYVAHRQNAARMMTNDDIRARLTHLQSKLTTMVAEETGVTVANVVKELAKLGFSTMKDYVRRDEHGHYQVDLANTEAEKWAAIQELTSETYTEGKGEEARLVRRTKIKLHGKEGALVSIGKHLGMFDKDRDRGSTADAPVPQAPSAERLDEMRRRYMPKSSPRLQVIEGGKEE